MAKRRPAAPRHPPPGSRGRVLLADDSVLTCELFGEYLTSRGFTVDFAHDGETAISAAVERKPDLIVIDISMPRLDGVAAIRRLKADERTRPIPVIVLTGHLHSPRQQEAQSAGAAAFVSKPCLPEEIERLIGDLLARAA
jgi:CheY-like chemotaxis protein